MAIRTVTYVVDRTVPASSRTPGWLYSNQPSYAERSPWRHPPLQFEPPPTEGSSNPSSARFLGNQPSRDETAIWKHPPVQFDKPETEGGSNPSFGRFLGPQPDRAETVVWHHPPLGFETVETVLPQVRGWSAGFASPPPPPPPVDSIPWKPRTLAFPDYWKAEADRWWNELRPPSVDPIGPIYSPQVPVPPPPPSVLSLDRIGSFINRVPEPDKDPSRLRLFVDKTVAVLNSLLGQGFIARTGERNQFSIIGGSYEMDRPPAATDDLTYGVRVGQIWTDTTAGTAYICVDVSVGAAVWKQIS